jgi:ABC-type glycerol-3-phosphate transport system permease component
MSVCGDRGAENPPGSRFCNGCGAALAPAVSRVATVPVALYNYFGDYGAQWKLVFAGSGITIAPILAFYLFAQRDLIRGFSGGIKS